MEITFPTFVAMSQNRGTPIYYNHSDGEPKKGTPNFGKSLFDDQCGPRRCNVHAFPAGSPTLREWFLGTRDKPKGSRCPYGAFCVCLWGNRPPKGSRKWNPPKMSPLLHWAFLDPLGGLGTAPQILQSSTWQPLKREA